MRVIRAVDLHTKFKEVCSMTEQDEEVVILRPHSKNMILISEKKYNNLKKQNEVICNV